MIVMNQPPQDPRDPAAVHYIFVCDTGHGLALRGHSISYHGSIEFVTCRECLARNGRKPAPRTKGTAVSPGFPGGDSFIRRALRWMNGRIRSGLVICGWRGKR